MWLKRLALIALIGIAFMVSCARVTARAAWHIGQEFEHETMAELGLSDQVRVTKRVGDRVVIDEVMTFDEIGNLEGGDFDFSDISVALDASEAGLSVRFSGKGEKDDVSVSAELNDTLSTIDIQIAE